MDKVDLSFLLGEAVATFWPRAEATNVALTLNVAPQVPAVKASAPQIRQVVDNLLDNALKYTSSGGFITVSCRPLNEQVAISITDNGQGISTADLPYIFERFYRADKARSRSGGPGGSGLGLSIVHSIIAAHNGQVSVDSQEGKGTTVRFTLPVYSEDLDDEGKPVTQE